MFGIYSTASGELASLSKEEGAMCQPMFRKTPLLMAWRADWRWGKLEAELPKAGWVPVVAVWTCGFLVSGCVAKEGALVPLSHQPDRSQ